MCSSFKTSLLDGLHAFGASVVRGSTAADTFNGALYFASAALGASTTVYSTTGEATGTGYTAGGVPFTFGTAPATSGTSAIVTPSASLSWSTVSITAFDTVLMYNATSASKLAVGVFTFGSQTVTAGTFTLTMPTNAVGTALLQIS